jgi:hypothetical protein
MNNDKNEWTFPLFSLLPEIIRLLPNYFLEEPEQNKSVFRFSHDWRNFMNTSKKQLGQWKKESQLIVLREPLVDNFYNSLPVRQQVLGYIEDPAKQLELEFNARNHHFNMGLGLIPFAPVRKRWILQLCAAWNTDLLMLKDVSITRVWHI